MSIRYKLVDGKIGWCVAASKIIPEVTFVLAFNSSFGRTNFNRKSDVNFSSELFVEDRTGKSHPDTWQLPFGEQDFCRKLSDMALLI
jgi:hypothetical protein